jgi:hypothetical protein
MENENEDILEIWKNLPKDCFTLQGVIFPKSQFQEVLEAWFSDEPLPPTKRPLPTPKRP